MPLSKGLRRRIMKSAASHLSRVSSLDRHCIVPMFSVSAADGAVCSERIGDFVRQLWRGCDVGSARQEKLGTDSLLGLLHNLAEVFHRKFRRQSPWILQMLERVSGLQRPRSFHLLLLRECFLDLWGVLGAHIDREELILFPLVRRVETSPWRRELLLGPAFSDVRLSIHEALKTSAADVGLRSSQMLDILDAFADQAGRDESLSCLFSVLESYLQSLQAVLDLEQGELYPRVQRLLNNGRIAPNCD